MNNSQQLSARFKLGLFVGAVTVIGLASQLSSQEQQKNQAVPVDQGPAWTAQTQAAYYTVDQGSRIMPLGWMQALQQKDGSAFLADSLTRYGYLANPNSLDNLPVGFTGAKDKQGTAWIGMTCAACHTRELKVERETYRLDGGPALANFQNFLTDLDHSVDRVLSDASLLYDFSTAVLGANRGAADAQLLEKDLRDWYHRYHTIMHGSLPKTHVWGPGRLDAMGMIINRLAGLDIGPPPTNIIASNIRKADAPVRYPFLWNADQQACTQWLGVARNDNPLFRTARNVGQVLGVFADFRAVRDPSTTELKWWARNSVNMKGLGEAEVLMSRIGAPKWPFEIDTNLAAVGAEIYQGNCESCHAANPGKAPWKTPVVDVGTDQRSMQLLERRVSTGLLSESIVQPPFIVEDKAITVLSNSVMGMLLSLPAMPHKQHADSLPTAHTSAECGGEVGYEAKVLHGVWAAAPYLHNGSVPSLADLLKPAAKRPLKFQVGPEYDIDRVGMAEKQVGKDVDFSATSCEDPASGRSNCGHEFGTKLSDPDKTALLEYLKSL
jgi:hypothetical protein